jgi:ADP-heptose:LPS heptosyltransferase
MRRPTLKVLVRQGIGDALLLTPALRQWKLDNPGGITTVFCTHRGHMDVLSNNPHVDFLRYMRPWCSRILSSRYLRRWASEIKSTDYANLLPSLTYRSPASSIMASLLNVRLDSTKLDLFLSPAELAAGSQRLSGLSRTVAINVAAATTNNKMWPDENWERVLAACPEYRFVQVGLSSETLVEGAVDFRGLSLRESFSVVANCSTFVGVDSAHAHAAVALGVPAIVIFGASVPDIWGHPTAVNLYAARRCSPCIDTLRDGDCPYQRACMSAIGPSLVIESIRTHMKIV